MSAPATTRAVSAGSSSRVSPSAAERTVTFGRPRPLELGDVCSLQLLSGGFEPVASTVLTASSYAYRRFGQGSCPDSGSWCLEVSWSPVEGDAGPPAPSLPEGGACCPVGNPESPPVLLGGADHGGCYSIDRGCAWGWTKGKGATGCDELQCVAPADSGAD